MEFRAFKLRIKWRIALYCRGPMQDVLIRKLESFEKLDNDDREILRTFVPRFREVPARTDLIREGDTPGNVHLILDGFACRYKVLPDGQRQVMAYFVPGDFCDLNVFILDQMDHNIGTISRCRAAEIPRQAVDWVTAHHPRLTRALWWCSLVDQAVLREWLVNMGGRSPRMRIAHLFCELLMRLDAVGHVKDNSYSFPFTQVDLAKSMGLSPIHINRTIRELKEIGLITLRQRVLTILDVEKMKTHCGFDSNYLHLKNARWSDRRRGPWLTDVQVG